MARRLQVLRVRASEAELAHCRAAAAARDLTLSAFIRLLIADADRSHPRPPPPDPGLAELARQVRRVGLNVNAIARNVHRGGGSDRLALLAQLAVIEAELEAVLERWQC